MKPDNDSFSENTSQATTDALTETTPQNAQPTVESSVQESNSNDSPALTALAQSLALAFNLEPSEKPRKKLPFRFVDRVRTRTSSNFIPVKMPKLSKKSSADPSRHPAYARFTRNYQHRNRQQQLSDILRHTLRDLHNLLFGRGLQSHFIKSPAYIRQRIAAEYPPPAATPAGPVFPGYNAAAPAKATSTPTTTPQTKTYPAPSETPFLSATQPTTIPLEDKEKLKAFYDSLPKEMAQELGKMVEIHAQRAPADASISLVLRPLPEHQQVLGKRKFEVNLKYTKHVAAASTDDKKSAVPKTTQRRRLTTSSSSTSLPSSSSSSSLSTLSSSSSSLTSSAISSPTSGRRTLKRSRSFEPERVEETQTKRLKKEVPNVLVEKKYFLWPLKSIVLMIKNEQYPDTSLKSIEEALKKSYKEQFTAFNPSKKARWPQASLKKSIGVLAKFVESSKEESMVVLSEAVNILASSLSEEAEGIASLSLTSSGHVHLHPTTEEVESRWEKFCALEQKLIAALATGTDSSLRLNTLCSKLYNLMLHSGTSPISPMLISASATEAETTTATTTATTPTPTTTATTTATTPTPTTTATAATDPLTTSFPCPEIQAASSPRTQRSVVAPPVEPLTH